MSFYDENQNFLFDFIKLGLVCNSLSCYHVRRYAREGLGIGIGKMHERHGFWIDEKVDFIL